MHMGQLQPDSSVGRRSALRPLELFSQKLWSAWLWITAGLRQKTVVAFDVHQHGSDCVNANATDRPGWRQTGFHNEN
jgi:hypothetical protein